MHFGSGLVPFRRVLAGCRKQGALVACALAASVTGSAAAQDTGVEGRAVSGWRPDMRRVGLPLELDGTALGLAYGIGGGLRLHQGRAMVIRFDVPGSPDAQPVGAYFSTGEMF